jgi:hypothetical protein
LAAGKHFADLHKKHMAAASRDKELNKGEYKNKAISMAVLSSWALVAGLLQNNVTALEKLYALPKKVGDKDPLGVKAMAESRHPKDPPSYRGLGYRYTQEDRGRVTEMFLQFALSKAAQKRITKTLVDSAIMSYEAKVAMKKAKELREKVF